jgi:hypothetical protein
MQSYQSTKRKWKLPLYDLGTLAAGFYIGYNEGKSIDTSATVEYFAKYGPTAFALVMTPLILKTANAFGRWMNRKMLQGLKEGNLEITIEGKTKKYKELNEDQKKEFTTKIVDSTHNLEYKLRAQKYLRPTLVAGTRTAIETAIGYAAGRLYSQIN